MTSSSATIYSRLLNLSQMKNVPYTSLPNTTLNEKYNVDTNVIDGYPIVKYFGIGVMHNIDLINGKRKYHQVYDGALFNQIPFRLSTTKLTDKTLFLEVPTTINNVQYFAYYLKEASLEESKILEVSGLSGNVSVKEFDTGVVNVLNPVGYITNNLSDKYLAIVSRLELNLSQVDMVGINEVVNILYPDGGVTLGELGVFSGKKNGDKLLQTQLMYFSELEYPVPLLNKTTLIMDVGGQEPLGVLNG